MEEGLLINGSPFYLKQLLYATSRYMSVRRSSEGKEVKVEGVLLLSEVLQNYPNLFISSSSFALVPFLSVVFCTFDR